MIRAKSITARPRTGALLLAVIPFLVGCNAEYTVKVHNEGQRPVRVRLIQDRVVEDPATLASAQVAPGRQATLGPVKVPMTDDVSLEVDAGEMGIPAGKQRLSSGVSEYRVGAAGEMTWGPPPISEVERQARPADGGK
ncbi:MAG: hypothetical protein IT436_06230 [Phycisphaerales bacterium]|nr:hypothetical protein [Phycisphaerales bacterium]